MTTKQSTTTTKKPRTAKKTASWSVTSAASSAEVVLPQAFLELAPDGIIVTDAAGHIQLVNQQVEILFGYQRSTLIGQPVEVLLPTRTRPLHAQHRASYMAAPHTRPMATGLELVGQRQDGSAFPVEVSLSPLSRGSDALVMAIIRDVTERKRLEREHQEQTERLRRQAAVIEAAERAARERHLRLLHIVLDQLPGGAYLVKGPDATLVLANRAARDIWGATWPLGVSMAEFLRASGVHFITDESKPLSLDALLTVQVARGGPPVRLQREVVVRPDGNRLPILLSAVAIETLLVGDDAERAALVLVQDISQLEALEHLKDQFITVAAHELRTPLAAIQGFASMLTVQTGLGRGPKLADWQQEAIDELEEASGRMNKIVNDLLDATRIQAGRLELHPVLLDLVAAVRRSLTHFQVSAPSHTLSLTAPEDHVMVEADGARLEQILGNLVGNAIKYSPDGGPIMLTMLVDPEVGVAELRIQDHGIGIPADQQGRLFGRFVRASNVNEHGIPGSGLGLYVCRELVERHGGQIWFESTEGVGTTFFVSLPLAPLPTQQPDDQGMVDPGRQRPGRHKRVTSDQKPRAAQGRFLSRHQAILQRREAWTQSMTDVVSTRQALDLARSFRDELWEATLQDLEQRDPLASQQVAETLARHPVLLYAGRSTLYAAWAWYYLDAKARAEWIWVCECVQEACIRGVKPAPQPAAAPSRDGEVSALRST